MRSESDLDLLRRISAGDRAAFERFFDRYRAKTSRFVSRLTWRMDVVEETVNDTMVAVWQTADRFRGDSRVSTGVLGIAYRQTMNVPGSGMARAKKEVLARLI